jgi:DNA-binding transcriptional MerR regulator
MFTIGEFARLGNVSVRTLHYYDDVGLLVPASVDATTNWRRYSAHQLPQLNRIVALKDLGFTLQQIRRMNAVSAEELRGMLLMRRSQLEDEISGHHVRLSGIEARLRQIEQEGDMDTSRVVVRPLPEVRVAQIGEATPGYDEALGDLIAKNMLRLHTLLGEAGIPVVMPPFAHYEGDPNDRNLVCFSAFDIGSYDGPVPDGVEIVTLPAVEAAATFIPGPEIEWPNEYVTLAHWIEDNGYEIADKARDVWLTTDRDELVKEIQWPIRPAAAVGAPPDLSDPSVRA